MRTTSKRVRAIVALLVVGALTSGCGSGNGDTKSGGGSPQVVLTMGTDDVAGRPSSDAIEEFARQVAQRSDGNLTVEPKFKAAGDDADDWDQQVARMIVAGDLDLGVIPARAWDTEGVTSMRALQAPFLVDSDALVDAIVTGDVADEALAGLDEIGIVGLTLLPEGLRHIYSFGDPLLGPADFDGALIRSPNSATSYLLFEALGARADDLPGDKFGAAIDAGTVAAAESSFQLASTLDQGTIVAGNVVVFPKLNTVVANAARLDELTDEQRQILEDAAQATLEWARGGVTPDAELANEFCTSQRGSVVLASDSDIAALRAAAEPVYATLKADPATAGMIDTISALKKTVAAPAPVAACTATPPSADDGTTAASPDIDGVYRYEVTAAYLTERGVTPDGEDGVHTITLRDGLFKDEWPNGECTGTYTSDGSRFTFRWDSGCYGDWSMTLVSTGDEVRWTEIESLPPHNDAESRLANEAFNSVPWAKVGDVESQDAASADFPEGSFRTEHTIDTLVAGGMARAIAGDYLGIWTMTFADGTVALADPAGDCHGTYEVIGTRVHLRLGDDPTCADARNKDFFDAEWTLDGDELHFVDLQAPADGPNILQPVFGAPTWIKVT